MSEEMIVSAVCQFPTRHVVLTGGEPSLFITASLCNMLHEKGKFIAIETNGTHSLPVGIDWVTLSPKDSFLPNAQIVLRHCDELKAVFDGNEPYEYNEIEAKYRYLQPCDTGDEEKNRVLTAKAIDYCMSHPNWNLSLQIHKFLNIR